MRRDMAKVVTEAPRRGHGNPRKKWGRRLNKDEYDSDDHGPRRAPIAAHRRSAGTRRSFRTCWTFASVSAQAGRASMGQSVVRDHTHARQPSLTGQHIFDHIRWEVEQHARSALMVVCTTSGKSRHRSARRTYVHRHGASCYKPGRGFGFRGGPFLKAQEMLRAFGFRPPVRTKSGVIALTAARLGAQGLRLVHPHLPVVPERLVRVITRTDGREVPIYATAHHEREATKQASKSEIQKAQRHFKRDLLARAYE